MDEDTILQGACSCGRNHYIIWAASNAPESIQVLYDDRAEHSRVLSLRVPLAQIHSSTSAHQADETPSLIRKVFTPRHAPHTKRQFCGVCGTTISHWSEESSVEADWIYVNLGTLKRESFEKLEDAGYLSNAANDESEEPATILKGAKKAVLVGQGREIRGSPWFEDLIEGSELGRIKRRRGGQSSADGKTIVEWEITEYEGVDEDFTVTGTGKRKLGSLDGGNDVEMRSD